MDLLAMKWVSFSKFGRVRRGNLNCYLCPNIQARFLTALLEAHFTAREVLVGIQVISSHQNRDGRTP